MELRAHSLPHFGNSRSILTGPSPSDSILTSHLFSHSTSHKSLNPIGSTFETPRIRALLTASSHMDPGLHHLAWIIGIASPVSSLKPSFPRPPLSRSPLSTLQQGVLNTMSDFGSLPCSDPPEASVSLAPCAPTCPIPILFPPSLRPSLLVPGTLSPQGLDTCFPLLTG